MSSRTWLTGDRLVDPDGAGVCPDRHQKHEPDEEPWEDKHSCEPAGQGEHPDGSGHEEDPGGQTKPAQAKLFGVPDPRGSLIGTPGLAGVSLLEGAVAGSGLVDPDGTADRHVEERDI
jgi:hypothetical protein